VAERLLLVDAYSNVFRAFYALPSLSSSRGVPTGATLGFLTMLQKVLRDERPDYVGVVWDGAGPNRRTALFPAYKAHREGMPDDLRTQVPWIRRAVDAFGLVSLELPGEEADDVIATIVRRALAEPTLEVEIVSIDRDLMQLVSDRVTLLDTMRERRFGPKEVEERFGVPPERVLDLRALVGDSSDNIPGVKGIGEKSAAALLREHGDLDDLLANASRVTHKRQREALTTGADAARLSRELSRLRTDLPVAVELRAMRPAPPDRAALGELFRELELKRLLEGVEGIPTPPSAAPAAAVATEVVRESAALDALCARLRGAPRLALGTVLDAEAPLVAGLAALVLADGAEQAFLVDLRALGEQPGLERLRPILEDASRSWVGFDLKTVWLALARRGVDLAGALRDASLAAYVVDPAQPVERPEYLLRAHLGRELPSEEDEFGKGAKRRSPQGAPSERLAAFFGPRAALALALDEALTARLEQTGQLALFETLEVPLAGVLGRMELAGVRIDEALLARLSRELESELAALERRIYDLAGERFLIQSPKQLQRVLFEKLALPPARRTKTGFSTDEAVLEELALEYELPREILAWRKLAKLKSTYVDTLPALVHPETGRIHCQFNQTVAATGRLSASNPNLQNIPVRTPWGQRIREAFIPAEGRLLLSADYSQIELRLLAHFSRDEALCAAFRSGDDVHVRTASQIFGVPPDQVSEEQRARVKAINFGIIYGSSAFGIARQLGISQAEAGRHIQDYFERYPGVRAFLTGAVEQARERGYSETLLGRRRYLPDLHSRNRALRGAAERMAMNSVLQGTAADLIKRAMIEIDRELRAPGAPRGRMILQVHDELVFEVAPEDADPLADRVARRMQEVAQLLVPLRVRIARGTSWREAH
jgi:DNA polymerase-1